MTSEFRVGVFFNFNVDIPCVSVCAYDNCMGPKGSGEMDELCWPVYRNAIILQFIEKWISSTIDNDWSFEWASQCQLWSWRFHFVCNHNFIDIFIIFEYYLNNKSNGISMHHNSNAILIPIVSLQGSSMLLLSIHFCPNSIRWHTRPPDVLVSWEFFLFLASCLHVHAFEIMYYFVLV